MSYFGRFYLDKEKDMVVDLFMDHGELSYVLRTPNHHTGNLITNLARLCGLPLSFDEQGLKVIRGLVPCYYDAYNERVYIFRLGGTKTANIYPDGRIEMKAQVPSISKTLMSQTKDYSLDIERTIVKTYLLSDVKFRTDLHTHMNANLSPDILIGLGIAHQIRYPLYYIKKLELKLKSDQWDSLAERRKVVEKAFADSELTGKYLVRRIDDHTFINFADLILNNLENAEYNIPRIRASLAIMKDGQAVFTNLEKVYLYRYVFTKGSVSDYQISLHDVEKIPDRDIADTVSQVLADRASETYKHNTLYQDTLLWIGRAMQRRGVLYIEISDTSLVKKDAAPYVLEQIHEVMPKIYQETGVRIRFLAAIRRIPLTIIKDRVTPNDYLQENLRVLQAVSKDPYVAGSDIIGEEINDIRELKPVIREIVRIAADVPGYVVRIHAGESDSLRDNVGNSIRCVKESLVEGQPMPFMRIGHGLYTSNLRLSKGKRLIQDILENDVILEFQITSNVRLNNLSSDMSWHPLKSYLRAGIGCVQGTDGGALYGTDSIDEQLALSKLLNLTTEDLKAMRHTEERIIRASEEAFRQKEAAFAKAVQGRSVKEEYEKRIQDLKPDTKELYAKDRRLDAAKVLRDRIEELPEEGIPLILAGGSFNHDDHGTRVREEDKKLIDRLLDQADPSRYFFVIGHKLRAQERYLLDKNQGRFRVYAFSPTRISRQEAGRLLKEDIHIRLSIEPSSMGLYKSISYEIFKRRPSILIAFDGNSAAANLIQEAKNGKWKCRIYINEHSRVLRRKAGSLQGYVTMFSDSDIVSEILTEKDKE